MCFLVVIKAKLCCFPNNLGIFKDKDILKESTREMPHNISCLITTYHMDLILDYIDRNLMNQENEQLCEIFFYLTNVYQLNVYR